MKNHQTRYNGTLTVPEVNVVLVTSVIDMNNVRTINDCEHTH